MMMARIKCQIYILIFIMFINIKLAKLYTNQRHCKHIYPKPDEVIHGVYIDPPHHVKKRNIDQPLRILLWYDESVKRLDPERFALITNTILPKAVNFWQRALSVRKSENVIRLNRKCNYSQVFVKEHLIHCIDSCREKTMCGEIQVPEEHLDVCRICNSSGQNCGTAPGSTAGTGVDNADFIFYVSATQTTRCNKGLTVAYAAHCQQEIALDRPIAGYANFCPESISTKPQELETLLSTVKHEILHALGFSASLYGFYRDAHGNPLTPRKPDTGRPPLNEKLQMHQWSDKVVKTVERPSWLVRGGAMKRTLHMMVTPKVVEEVRRHFKCTKVEGAELEDQGEDGTALTHWEKRVFENEAMTGTHTQNPVISRITFALMEDTGWYKVNYSMAEPMSWGRGLGCDFVMKSCKEWMAIKSAKGRAIHPFCNKVKRDPLQTECTDDRSSVALCNLAEHTEELPPIYQNFDYIEHVESGRESFYGGSVSLADYCPYIQEFTWRFKNVTIRGSQCQYKENTPSSDKNFALESYGNNSRCFEHTRQMWEEKSCDEVRQWRHWGSGCYQYNCNNSYLNIIVENYTFTCHFPGQEIMIRIVQDKWLHKGGILCPPCQELCGDELAKIGKRCRIPEEAPPSNFYPRNDLICSCATLPIFNLSTILLIVFFYRTIQKYIVTLTFS